MFDSVAAATLRSKFAGLARGVALLAVMVVPLAGHLSALADGADHSLPAPMVFTATNPCTGAVMTVTQTWEKAVLHDGSNAGGQAQVTFTGTGTIVTSDGFSGRFAQRYGGTGTLTASRGESSGAFSATLTDGSGTLIIERAVFHAMFDEGTMTFLINSFTLECAGRPAP